MCCSVIKHGNIPHHRFHLNLLFDFFFSNTLPGFGVSWSREEILCSIFFSRLYSYGSISAHNYLKINKIELILKKMFMNNISIGAIVF